MDQEFDTKKKKIDASDEDEVIDTEKEIDPELLDADDDAGLADDDLNPFGDKWEE